MGAQALSIPRATNKQRPERTRTLCARAFSSLARLAVYGLVLAKLFLDLAEAFLELALALVDLAADLGRPVAAELAGLFLDLAFRLVPLAFDLVVHSVPPWSSHLLGGPDKEAQIRCHRSRRHGEWVSWA